MQADQPARDAQPVPAEPNCIWCGRAASDHGPPGESEYAKAIGKPEYRLCPTPGVTSQFFTPRPVPTEPTPGQVAHLAYRASSIPPFGDPDKLMPAHRESIDREWREFTDRERAAWESAAQAVQPCRSQDLLALCNTIAGSLEWMGDGYEWNPTHGDYRENPLDAVRRGSKEYRDEMRRNMDLYAAVVESNTTLRSALDAVTRELESARHLLAGITEGDSREWPAEVRECVEGADLALGKAKACR